MHRLFALVFAIGLTFSASGALAGTPDGKTPAQETICNALKGAAYGVCNAYCEAQDCDTHSRPSCIALRKKFKSLTGTATFPCDRLPCGYAQAPACGGACPTGQQCVPGSCEGVMMCGCQDVLIGDRTPGH